MKTPVLYPLAPRPAVAVFRSRRRPAAGILRLAIFLSLLLTCLWAVLAVALAALAAGAVAFALHPVTGWIPACFPAVIAAGVILFSFLRFVR
jgi:hypothetical protein